METIDTAFYRFINETLNISCTTNEGWKKVPVKWVTPERAYQIKSDPDARDGEGTLVFPIMTIHRASVAKDPSKKGSYQANLGPLRNRRLAGYEIQQSKTRAYASRDSVKIQDGFQPNFLIKKEVSKPVYKYYYTPIPIYITVNYELNIITNYQQQINEIHQKLINVGSGQNYFVISEAGYNFECFMEMNFNIDSNPSSMSEDERKYTSKVTTRILGYLIGDGDNKDDSQVKIVENTVEIAFPTERVVSKNNRVYPRAFDQDVSLSIQTEQQSQEEEIKHTPTIDGD
jgi:hypothetical protein